MESAREKVFELQRERQGMDERTRALEIERQDLLQAVDSWRDNFKQVSMTWNCKANETINQSVNQSVNKSMNQLTQQSLVNQLTDVKQSII